MELWTWLCQGWGAFVAVCLRENQSKPLSRFVENHHFQVKVTLFTWENTVYGAIYYLIKQMLGIKYIFFFQRNKTHFCWGDFVTTAPCCSVTVGLLTVYWRLKHLRQSVSPLLCLQCALLFIVVLRSLLYVPLSAFALGVCSYLCSLRHRQCRGAERPPRKPWKRGPGNKRLVWDFCCPLCCQAPQRGWQLVALSRITRHLMTCRSHIKDDTQVRVFCPLKLSSSFLPLLLLLLLCSSLCDSSQQRRNELL